MSPVLCMATNPQNMSACFSHPSHPPWCPHLEKGQQALTLQDPSLQGTWSDMSQETLDSFAVFSESIEQCKLARTCFIYYIINIIKHIHKPKIKQTKKHKFQHFSFPSLTWVKSHKMMLRRLHLPLYFPFLEICKKHLRAPLCKPL